MELNKAFSKLSAPAQRALASAKISNLVQLSKLTEAYVRSLHGLGPSTIVRLKEAMSEKGLAFIKELP